MRPAALLPLALLALAPALAASPRTAKQCIPSVVYVGAGNDYGSGTLIDPRGYVLTCRHVVSKAPSLSVKLSDGAELVASVVASDAGLDLALLRVNAGRRLPFLRVATTTPPPGTPVLAIGHPFEHEWSVSRGVISGHGRELPKIAPDAVITQTDAALNPGNSGGPLIDKAGSLVGVAVATTNAHGLGFAVSAEDVSRFLARHLPELLPRPAR